MLYGGNQKRVQGHVTNIELSPRAYSGLNRAFWKQFSRLKMVCLQPAHYLWPDEMFGD